MLKKKAAVDNAKIFKDGVKQFKLPPEYAKAYIKTIIDANWGDAAKRKYTVDYKTLKSKMIAGN